MTKKSVEYEVFCYGGQYGPKGPAAEARRAESGSGFLGEGQPAPPHQLGVWGRAVNSPSGVRDGAPAAERFCLYLNAPDTVAFPATVFGLTHSSCVTKVPAKHT